MLNKIVNKIEGFGHFTLLALSWIFGLLFLWAGIFDTKTGGVFFVAISLLLLPPVRAAVYSLTNRKIHVLLRSASILSLFIVFMIINNQNQQPMQLEAQATVTAKPIKQAKKTNNLLVNKPTSTQINPIMKDNLPEKVVQLPTPTKQTIKIEDKKSNSELDTKDILAKLKDIPVSEYELNRNLYQQLVAFNPNKDKYKKKLSFYTKKIEQRSRNDAKKNIKLSCENIRKNNTVDYSLNWLSDNENCLSKEQKKKMEIVLFNKVKKIPSKNIKQNWEGYKSLSILNPTKKYYLNKMKQYKNKLDSRTAKI